MNRVAQPIFVSNAHLKPQVQSILVSRGCLF